MPISDEGDAATCMAAEGGHVIGSQPIASSVDSRCSCGAVGRLGCLRQVSLQPWKRATSTTTAGGWGQEVFIERETSCEAVDGFELKSGDKVTVTHEASQKY